MIVEAVSVVVIAIGLCVLAGYIVGTARSYLDHRSNGDGGAS